MGWSHRISANSGTSWARLLCCRCWTAKVFTLGFGGGENERFFACKNVLTAVATRAANKSGYAASLDVSKDHVPFSART